jgi:hypothetical protein
MTNSSEPGSAGAALRKDTIDAKGRVPDFFIVGTFKCGTSALYEMLRCNPQIYMPRVKETWFYSPELRGPVQRPGRTYRLEEYLSLYDEAGPAQRLGDNSPSYLMSHFAAERIAQAQPGARIIAIVREPASFLRSYHLQSVENHIEPEANFRKALALESERREGRRIPRHCDKPHELLYSEHVRYVEQLSRYYAVFPAEQILVLIYEDFRRDNVATVRAVLRHLDLDDAAPVSVVEANPSVRVRSRHFYDLVRSVYLGRGLMPRALKAGTKALTTQRLRHGALRAIRERVIFGDPPTPDEEIMLELRRRFKGEVVALSEYLDRDLVSQWGYDDVD